MESITNILITIFSLIVVLFIIGLVHELGHYFVARVILKDPNVKITMGFFGKTIYNSKRFKINKVFFFGAYVGNYSDSEVNRFHMMLLFAAGAIFQILFILPIVLYITGGVLSLGDFLNFQGLFSSHSPLRTDLFSVPLLTSRGFAIPWLSLATPMDYFNMFLVYMRNINSILLCFIVFPYFYPLKLHGSSWHWNPSDGMWVLKFMFNKVSEKDAANAAAAINEKND
jgi:hypothetical protein